MEPKLVKSISIQVYRRFPEVAEKKPKVRLQSTPKGKDQTTQVTYLLTYQTKAEVQGGKTLNRYVRVVADQKGKILKITTSR